jgi:hypothetical protein
MKIFIGSSVEAADKANPDRNLLLKIAGILRNAGAEPIPWDKQPSIFSLGLTTIENLEELVKKEHIDAAVFIYSSDDKTWYRGETKTVPRDNVVFEHGLFTGILGREKAITIKIGDIKMPSDLYGVTCIDYNVNPEHAVLNIMQWVKNLPNNTCGTNNNDISINYHLNIKMNQKMIEFIDIPQGTYYRMLDDNEIIINNPLSISKYLITQSIYYSIIGNNPSYFKGDSLPVENISFLEAIIFCNKLSLKESYNEVYKITDEFIHCNKDTKGYRLPFEVEWEYALGYNNREIQENLNTLAWYNNNSNNKTHDIGLKKENRYGLFDLLGNVWEWCFDNYKDQPLQISVLENNNKLRVLRGGSFADFESMFTKEKAFRKKESEFNRNRFTGFRIILQK